MQIIEQQHQWPPRGNDLQVRDDRVHELVGRLCWRPGAEWRRQGLVGGDGTRQIREEFTPGTESRDAADFVAARDGDRGAPYGGFLGQILGQGGLADAGLTTKEDEAAVTGEGRGQLLAQKDLLTLPADEDGSRVPCGVAGLPEVAVGHGEPRINAPPRRVLPHTYDGEDSRPWPCLTPAASAEFNRLASFRFYRLIAATAHAYGQAKPTEVFIYGTRGGQHARHTLSP